MAMRRILLEITPELASAVDAARGTQKRNPAIEDWLWRIGAVRDAARQIGVERRERPKMLGRRPKRAPDAERTGSTNGPKTDTLSRGV